MGASLTYHERLGRGASGTVHRVTWKSKEFGTIEAAAKKIPYDGEITDQQKREIEFLKKLDHRNIIRYYDTVIEKEHVVIVTEFAAKGSLYDYLKETEKLPDNLLNQWIYHLASGINYLDQNNVAHCDLKSPNCILTADDVLKICDFGIARDLTSTKTTEGAIKGSWKWQAPEIFKDVRLSPKAAIYAFGIIVWEMVSCEEPYKGKRSEFVVYNVMVNELRPTIPADCPPSLRELMEECWHQDHTKRPESKKVLKRVILACPTILADEADGLEWQLKHKIGSDGVLCFVSSNQLAICRDNSVEVHHVSRGETHLLYTLTCDEWGTGVWPMGVAVSDSMPDSILVICKDKSYVYQFPCNETSSYVKKYQIHDGNVYSWCIAANANTAVIGLERRKALVVCSLPGFTQQRIVHLDNWPLDLTISSENLLLIQWREMVMKPLSDLSQDMCKIQPPDGCEFRAVSYRNDAGQLYATCYHRRDEKHYVNKYVWDGKGVSKYVNTGCVIEDVGNVYWMGLAVTPPGLFAISNYKGTKILCLE